MEGNNGLCSCACAAFGLFTARAVQLRCVARVQEGRVAGVPNEALKGSLEPTLTGRPSDRATERERGRQRESERESPHPC